MRLFGTDVVAVACILGGAAVGGAATMAFLSAQEPARVGTRCAVNAVTAGPQIVVTRRGDGNAVVVSTPHIRIHSNAVHDCVKAEMDDVTVHLEEAVRQMEGTRARIITGVRLDEAREMMMQMKEAQALEAEARLEEVGVILEKVEKGTGGQM